MWNMKTKTVVKNKLKERQWFELQEQYFKTPSMDESFGASGQHYILIMMLNNLGYYPVGKPDSFEMAEELLANGYIPD